MSQPLNHYFRVRSKELKLRGVLNAHLGIDNLLFVDPNLLTRVKIPEFHGAREDLTNYFSSVIKLLTKSREKGDVAWREAEKRLTFQEEHGAALGYAGAGGYGRAVGPELAAALVERGHEIVSLGIDDPEIFELIGLFQEGVGPDLLSDMAVAILRDRFLHFTGRITRELDLKPQRIFHFSGRDWILPVSPDGKRPLVLVPSSLLNELPVALDRSEIDDVAVFNAEVRAAWNKIIALAGKQKRQVSKREIREILLANPKNLKDLIEVYRNAARSSYDFEKDPDGLFSWDLIGRTAAETTPLRIEIKAPATVHELRTIVNSIVAQFKKNVEENRLYEVLYKENGVPRREVFAQRLFYAIADAYCAANNIDLSREPDAGNGPVDSSLALAIEGECW